MSLLDKASLIVTPNAVKESKLYSVVPSSGAGDMDVVRATTATRVNSSGLIEVVPRNLLTYSEQFDNAAWTKNNLNVTANATIAPNGTMTAEKIVGTAINATHIALQQVPFSVNTVATCTIYAKAAELNFLYIGGLGRTPSANEGYVFFNLSNGTVGANDAGYTGSISNEGNGWYRLTVNAPSMPTSTLREFRIGVTNTNGMQSYLGDGTSGVFVWGAQLVEGSTATEYFPTTTRLNIPRIDYTNGSCPSLLVEPQRTNTLTYSNEFSNVAWTKIASATITFNSAIANPQGGGSFYLTASNLSFGGILRQLSTFVIGQTYTSSFFVKKGNYRYVGLRINGSVNGLRYPTYDFDTDTFDKQGVTCTVNRTLLTNGWIKLSLTYTANNADTSCDLALVPSNGDVQTALSGGQFVYVYGAQLELGAYATSYIPTVASSVTRNADVISKTGISSLIGQTEGTIFADIVRTTSTANDTFWVNISDGSTNDWMFMGTEATAGRFYVRVGNSAKVDEYPSFSVGRHKLALAYKSGQIAGYMDGVQLFTSTATFTLTSLTRISLGPSSPSSTVINTPAQVNQVVLFPTRLTNAELAQLTTL